MNPELQNPFVSHFSISNFKSGSGRFFKGLLYVVTAHRTVLLSITKLSAIFRPSDHTVGRPQAEIRTREGRSRGRDSKH